MSKREIIAVSMVAGVLLLAAVGILQVTGVSHAKLRDFGAMALLGAGIASIQLVIIILLWICLRLFGRKK